MTASNNQDIFAVTIEAFNLSETFRSPVILLLDEIVAHTREKLVIPEPGEINVVEMDENQAVIENARQSLAF